VTLSIRRLRRDLDRLSAETWGKIVSADSSRISFGETTITDINLLSLKQLNPDLELHQFNQNQEATSGADWAWWVGNESSGWIGMHFQAKRSRITKDRSTPQYLELGHRVKGTDTLQSEVLALYANEVGGDPLLSLLQRMVSSGWPISRNKRSPLGVRGSAGSGRY